ncbi:MAG: hypothetical protein WDW38_006946 [Sanguina aurantia]
MVANAAPPRVAIIGGGISGLICGNRLKQLGLDSVVFDTGKNAVGGRASTRQVTIQGQKYFMDHSTQALVATTERFQRMVTHWEGLDLLQQWDPRVVGTLQPGGRFRPRPDTAPKMYINKKEGVSTLVSHLASSLTVQQPVWVSRLQRRPDGDFDVHGEGRKFPGSFQYAVVAHNGKCADKLMSTANVPAIHALLKVKFQAKPSPQQVMQLSSIWVLLVAFPAPLKLPWEGAFTEGVPELSWAANNSAKMQANRSPAHSQEVWTIISSREFGAAHKVPQENVPPQKDAEVKALLLAAFARAAGLDPSSLRPTYMRAQLWGAAVPMNVASSPCVLDAESRIGICGDWLVSPSVEGAALSGLALAEQIAAHHNGTAPNSVGLDAHFTVKPTPAIGDFGDGGGGSSGSSGNAAPGPTSSRASENAAGGGGGGYSRRGPGPGPGSGNGGRGQAGGGGRGGARSSAGERAGNGNGNGGNGNGRNGNGNGDGDGGGAGAVAEGASRAATPQGPTPAGAPLHSSQLSAPPRRPAAVAAMAAGAAGAGGGAARPKSASPWAPVPAAGTPGTQQRR